MEHHDSLKTNFYKSDLVKWICSVALIAVYIFFADIHFGYLSLFSLWLLVSGFVAYETSKLKLREHLYSVQLTVLVIAEGSTSIISVLLLTVPVFVAMASSADRKVLFLPALASFIFAMVTGSYNLTSFTIWTATLLISGYTATILDIITARLRQMISEVEHFNIITSKHRAFVNEIANGSFQTEKPFSNDDLLGNALFDMGLKVKASYDGDRIRNWQMTGLNEVSNKLRFSQQNDASFNDVLSYLVKYLDANQGGIFVVNKENPQEVFLEMTACYAYEKHKLLNRKVSITEGLLGECVVERELIYLEKVPNNYVNITSGLGFATPKTLIIIPLKFNDEVLGVLELASFSQMKKHEHEFLLRVGEIIGSALSYAQKNSYTNRMLQESQKLTEELRAQQEEIRQNLEELEATQEHLTREAKEREFLEHELKKSTEFLNLVLDSVPIPVFAKDRQHRMVLLNKAVCELNNRSRDEMLGKTDYDFFPRDQAEVFWNFEEQIFVDRSSDEKIEHAIRNGKETYTLDKKLAVRTNDGDEFLIGINIDVTHAEMIKRQQQSIKISAKL